jgi:hypothetical protein
MFLCIGLTTWMLVSDLLAKAGFMSDMANTDYRYILYAEEGEQSDDDGIVAG